ALSQTSARWPVLERPPPSAKRNQDSLLLDWRSARRLSRFHPAHVRASQSAAEGHRGPVESHLSPRRRARAGNRMARSSPPLVGLLAQEPQRRNHGRASASHLHAGVARSRSAPEKRARKFVFNDSAATEKRSEHNSL